MPRIRTARCHEFEKLALVEQSAASLFRDVGLAWLADGETMDAADLLTMCRAGTLWIAADDADEPVGFLAGRQLDSMFYIAEVSVARSSQRQGIGAALVATAIEFARTKRFSAVTLTTYRDLSWNAPFYSKLGFVEIDAAEAGSGHVAQLHAEAKAGHDLERRCVMMKSLR